jgi:uncharacterized protein (TIGR00375 family)
MIFADLHMHSKYSRATSKNLDIPNLEKWGKIKGLNLIGTGDFQHPLWLENLKRDLVEQDGILKSKGGMNFLLQTEISLIYTQGGKGRRIHHIILAPNFEVVDQIQEALGKKGRLDYDGRPIFGFDSIELIDMMREISEDIEVIPAHIWTPWFGLLGSKSGFDSIKECFGDRTKYIHALETGLSSDPAMNWRISSLDKYTLISNSDSHSFWPWRIGRETNIFDVELTYKNILNAIRTKKGLKETIEVDPSYGKYHIDGHRNCNISFEPDETKKNKGICPKCGKALTIGVLNRVEELADRPEGFKPEGAIPFKKLIPLAELISKQIGVKSLNSKSVFSKYMEIIDHFKSEFDVLLNENEESLSKFLDKRLVDLIIKNREGKLLIKPGYDGVYGELVLENQKQLGSF